jgi:transposase
MEQEVKFYLGIDVSKSWFDLSWMKVINRQKESMLTVQFENSPAGLKEFGKYLKANAVPSGNDTLLVIENTGVYHRLLWAYCSDHGIPIYVGNAARIKWSLGITRGKNDQIDSQRLCSYCYKQSDEIIATPALNPVFMKLKDMITAREKLVSQVNTIKMYINELKLSNTKEVQQMMEKTHKAAINGINESVKLLEANILQLIREDSALKTNYDLLVSVPGIGHVTAVYLICCTNNFAGTLSGKQLACYAGVVPFGDTSGSSMKKREKVHKMANKDLKKLLHMCALSAIKNNEEIKAYYERKKEEGKHPMAILNAIRNKIALRAVAVIKKQASYENNYKKAA